MLAREYEATGQKELAKSSYEKGIEVSNMHGHPSMAEEYRSTLELDYR